MASHGTPEGFRLHKKLERDPCPACQEAMDRLLDQVRAFQASVRGTMPAVVPLPPFTQHMLAKRAGSRAAEAYVPTELPPVSMAKARCSGDEHFLPRSVSSSVAKKAKAAGWWVSITRAAGPRIDAKGTVPEGREQVFTIAVAAARGDDRLVWVWHFVLKAGAWKWELDEVTWNKKGLINNTDGKKVLDA